MTHEHATPLIALDAVALDTETTGLDPVNARVVEVGAVRLAAGAIDPATTYRSLVRPGIPIPPSATAIHGIDDQAVANARAFPEIWSELSAFIGGRIVIGHSIGFDLAVLKRECERAGLAWRRPRSLCVRLLGEVAGRELAGHSLDQLADWLGIEVTKRHAALSDASLAAQVFRALLPRLRERGIRTLAEAEQASHQLTAALTNERRAGWVQAVEAPAPTGLGAIERIDTYPYRHRVRDVMRAPPLFVTPQTTVGAAIAEMERRRVSSLFVGNRTEGEHPRPQDSGIVTERDALRAIAEQSASALARPVSSVASRPLHSIHATAFVYQAMARMNHLKVRHLGVEGEDGRVCGALSARDLLRLRAEGAITLGDQIEQSDSIGELGRAWATTPSTVRQLIAESVHGRDIAAVVSRQLCELTRRATVLAERDLAAAGAGEPPCPYAFAVLGSAGRGESLLALDQDNALIFAEGEPGGDADRWFERLGTRVADILNELGVPYCAGGIMAKNPQWRGSLATWRDRIGDWIRRSKPQDLLSVDIFFDLLGVHGDLDLANSLWRYGFDAARGEIAFTKLLAERIGPPVSSFGIFGTIRTTDGRIDLKKAGLFQIVSIARVLAIRHNVVARSTPERMQGLVERGIGAADDLTALADAQGILLDLIVRQQIADIDGGIPASNKIEASKLSRIERQQLRAALETPRHQDVLVRDLMFAA